MKWIDLPPVWLALFLAAGWAQARWLPVGSFGAWGDVAGGLLVLAGLALLGAATVEFVRARTTIIPRQTPGRLITRGVYRLSRNPIYLADLLILVGLSLRWDALLSLVLAPVFVWLIARRFITGEEARMQAVFGADYDDYAARVRRWI